MKRLTDGRTKMKRQAAGGRHTAVSEAGENGQKHLGGGGGDKDDDCEE